ncbi:integrating conjugative element protein [Pseudomonas sp. MWU13-2105]|uniref:integrating conjugative element protein n=1 Tax=Pseudomonas sp. MWU13-2105 TaxID=2935074 RepID=UPI00200CDC78|nr:integrating conjugative element protein [Pseudomonas sp. MWU13-2105]
MTPTHHPRSAFVTRVSLATLALGAVANLLCSSTHAELIVVDDRGGASTLAYYRSLNLLPDEQTAKAMTLPPVRTLAYSEADMLPVKSPSLSPGTFENRVHDAAGLQPVFLVGDDELSRQWLQRRGDVLREIKAVGWVVNVQQMAALTELRTLGTGLDMVPAAADDLAQRLGIEHYPALVTATGIEQ